MAKDEIEKRTTADQAMDNDPQISSAIRNVLDAPLDAPTSDTASAVFERARTAAIQEIKVYLNVAERTAIAESDVSFGIGRPSKTDGGKYGPQWEVPLYFNTRAGRVRQVISLGENKYRDAFFKIIAEDVAADDMAEGGISWGWALQRQPVISDPDKEDYWDIVPWDEIERDELAAAAG